MGPAFYETTGSTITGSYRSHGPKLGIGPDLLGRTLGRVILSHNAADGQGGPGSEKDWGHRHMHIYIYIDIHTVIYTYMTYICVYICIYVFYIHIYMPKSM